MVKEVLEVIKDLTKTGITMAIVTHEMGFAREIYDRILFLDQGRLAEDASLTEFFSKNVVSPAIYLYSDERRDIRRLFRVAEQPFLKTLHWSLCPAILLIGFEHTQSKHLAL
jgi:ABC-type methionine transport system ATPase subunit